ncbi:hypothetical protein [Cryobacterium sp. BB736]|uniref:hypothetical protein n=1 Tax=Cryobacterium sp. BB736 TaxID=2746963 RepID=UPI001874CC17|nr:hypothetical protein [Cryobacterium sp. BB736]
MRLRRHSSALAVVAATVLLLVGCATPGPGGTEPAGPGDNPGAAAPDDNEAAAERAAMECVTGAWVAETPALQEFFDQAVARAGASDFQIIAEGSIVYEFIEHGFGLIVIPTAFAMRMPTEVGDVVGTMTGQASGMWTVKGQYIHAAGEDWQMALEMRWTFNGQAIEADTGAQSMTNGFTDIDRFECDGDVLVLQSHDGPPLTLERMTQLP